MQDELEFFQTWWKILRKYWNLPAKEDRGQEANAFWNGLCDECRVLWRKYKGNTLFEPFARKMCLELIHEVQRRSDVIER
ncbi:hypothetical protein D7V86_03830 [bacterium D16-51]|nr:hypothetical protein D7V96_00090 [bacterium D16-59]RKI61929.1 hypothetical protein D7V86_03830 [bacterium D16-51]